eukprot:Plantae.Rhodophyta-Rhodochaete_pulchella.ctg10820.p1 GENE.Plantae.Rhodophyta-Rhodochaete_pulchella.ctg10820~~Plantae.Rhodophyta-Rhodochaete_pulchella.ctg10820.p1  ORF type:complete len:271 (-),score=39.61 Plantae.Rhodophyta-Rhodochaete_pulchella.ctg10820:228-1040(-)
MDYLRRAASLVENFDYVPDQSPLSRTWIPLTTCAVYYLLLRALRHFMRNRKAPEIPMFLFVHNIFLSIASLLLFVPLVYTVIEKAVVNSYGPTDLLCSMDFHEEDGRLKFFYFVNHLFKYYELLDTVLLVVRKKPVPFLHEYHHAATLVLTWSQLREHSTVQWVPISINLLVHVIMYYYYAMTALKIRIWWKKYLTTLQIAQFVVDVIACSYAYTIFVLNGMRYDKCHGTQVGAITGIIILSSYLVLFVRFYLRTYNAPRKDREVGQKEE